MREAAGAFVGAVHVFPMRVYFEDTDAAGIVYYANYLKFAERARTEMLREMGVNHARMMADDGLAFTVRRCSVDYLKPARLDDRLEVHTRLLEVRGASLVAEQTVRGKRGDLARLGLRLACTDSAGRPARMPGRLRARLSDLCNTNERD